MSKPLDLVESIDKKETVGLNIDDHFPLSNIFLPDERLVVRSDSDEQIIITFAFNTTVNLQSVKFSGPFSTGSPKTIRLFTNLLSVSFQDIDQHPPTQVLELTRADFEESAIVNLRAVKFQKIVSLTMFIESNHGADLSTLGKIKLLGQTVAVTNVQALKKVGEDDHA